MKILITGTTGMVGRNLVENNQISKHDLLAPSSAELNLLNVQTVKDYLAKHQPDMVIHCAGKVGGIEANMQDLYGYCSENLIMGVNLVTSAKEAGIKKFLNLSSSCTYPKDFPNPLKEEYVLQGTLEPTNEGYAIAKLTVLKLCEYISKQSVGFEYKTLIPCNLYGRWDKFDPQRSHMLPAVIRRIHESKKLGLPQVEIWGDGTVRREFMIASDLASLMAEVVDRFSEVPLVMNAGVGIDHSVNDYYEMVKRVIGYEGEFTHDLSKPVGMREKLLDVSAQTSLNWKPLCSLEKGIQETYDFYLQHVENS